MKRLRSFFQESFLKGSVGMTLIEIMVVVSIIGLVMAMVTVNVMSRFAKAKVDTARTQIKALEQSLEQYYLDNGSYPSTEQGLSALVEAPSGSKRFQPGGYLKGGKVPKDPWGTEFEYVSPGATGQPFDIVSIGPDRQEGTDDDIKSTDE